MAQVDINRANLNELEQVFHSRERAQEILNRRELHGNFRDWEDFREQVHGISDGLMQNLQKAGVSVGKA